MEVQHSETDVQGDIKKRWRLLGTPTSIYKSRQNQNILLNHLLNKMENLPTLSETVLQDMPIDFFDFTFILNADGSMKECKFN